MRDQTNSQSSLLQINASGGLDFWFQYGGTFYNRATISNTGAATFSGNVIIGGSTPVYLKFNVQETSANRVAILYRGIQGADASMVTAFGTPYLSIGAQENLVNSIQTIGFGFTNGTSYIQPAEIGFQTTSLSGYTLGDLVFATRGVTTNTAPTERMRITSGGNVGIGTTSPLDILQVEKNQNASTAFYFTNSTSGTASRSRIIVNSDASAGNLSFAMHSSSHASFPNEGWIFTSGVSTPLILATTGTERMRITTAGNVGIGTTSPTALLSIKRGASGDNMEFIGSGANGYSDILFYNTDKAARLGYIDWSNTQVRFNVEANIPLAFHTNTIERMRITSGGSVAIGSTSADYGKLDITVTPSSYTAALGLGLQTNSGEGNSVGISFKTKISLSGGIWENARIAAFTDGVNSSAYGSLAFYTMNATTLSERMRIQNNGLITFNSVVYGYTTTSTTRTLFIGGDYTIGGISSIRASKKNIENVSNVDWLYELNPVTFNYRKKDLEGNYSEEIYEELNYGLIAEDTAPIADFLINYNDKEDGTKEMIGIEYSRLISPMLKAIQELKAEIDILKQ